jgi:hypothetical protein
MRDCNVPGCRDEVRARGLCSRHYSAAADKRRPGYAWIAQYAEESINVQRDTCACPDARHDDKGCPSCGRPSYSPERIAYFRNKESS